MKHFCNRTLVVLSRANSSVEFLPYDQNRDVVYIYWDGQAGLLNVSFTSFFPQLEEEKRKRKRKKKEIRKQTKKQQKTLLTNETNETSTRTHTHTHTRILCISCFITCCTRFLWRF
jgi:uncharacterized protein YdaU (DUF1376 family)